MTAPEPECSMVQNRKPVCWCNAVCPSTLHIPSASLAPVCIDGLTKECCPDARQTIREHGADPGYIH
jgi:hypothetical protein